MNADERGYTENHQLINGENESREEAEWLRPELVIDAKVGMLKYPR